MKAKYKLSQEDKELLPKWRDQVIAACNSVVAMTDEDKQIAEKAVFEIYEKAKLDKPKVVFVKSPFQARFASGFYAALMWKKANKKIAAADAVAVAADAAAA
ncbi:MAG TPA: hypothetical protein VFF49_04665, partial [Thermodesulfobacteriota bacterium]|nr:hypothetical protein [Thermodesulfobacteriota bacterium]